MKKRLLVLALTLCMALCLLPVAVQAAEVVNSGTCGDDLTWTVTDEGVLTISGTGPMYDYEYGSITPWGEAGIVGVEIKEGVTTIGSRAFLRCTSLTEITIPDSVTTINYGAFLGCTGLTSVTIPDGVTTIAAEVFKNCTGLTGITIPDSVTKIAENAFSGCTGLTGITIPDSLTEISRGVFSGCTGLTGITIPNSVTAIGSTAFKGCTGLTGITIPDSVTAINYDAFLGCTGLTGVTIPDSVTKIDESVFSGCTGLTGIAIPDSVTEISRGAFYGCTGLTSVTIPDKVTMIGNYAFSGCTGLTSVTIPNSVTTIAAEAFKNCIGLTTITIPDSVTTIGGSAFSGCTGLTEITIPGNVTVIYSSAFSGCTGLTEITIPNSVTEIGPGPFSGCTSLKKIHVEKGNSAYCSIDGVLYNKARTILVSFPGGDAGNYSIPDSVTTIGDSAFSCHTGLTGITIPDSVTTIGNGAFQGCTGLTSVTVPDSVTRIGRNAFEGCTALKKIVFAGNNPLTAGEYDLFPEVTATCYYPANNATWTKESLRDYGGTITWVSYEAGQEPTDPALTEPSEEQPRLAGSNRFETANLVGDQIKANLGIEKFDAVVVASGTDFADALAGSYLASAKKAPILLAYNDTINEGVKDYIKANLNPGGTVYILGGGKAVPESFKDGLEEQFTVNRLAGGNRFETNLLVLQEAGVGDKPILVCTGLTFADSLSASATKLPILLVYGNKLLPEQAAFMESVKGRELYIIGGEGAVSKNMETALTAYGTVERVAGGNRFETSVMIAEKFFAAPESAVLAYAWGFPDGLCGGPLAAAMNAPLILTMDKYESKAAEYIQSKGIASGTILGGEKLIPESSINKIFP